MTSESEVRRRQPNNHGSSHDTKYSNSAEDKIRMMKEKKKHFTDVNYVQLKYNQNICLKISGHKCWTYCLKIRVLILIFLLYKLCYELVINYSHNHK